MIEPKEKPKTKSTAAKIVIAFVVLMLLGLGLCGIGATLSDHFSVVSDDLFVLGAMSFWASLLGLIPTALVLLILGLGKKDK